jgi:hypothetical protein
MPRRKSTAPSEADRKQYLGPSPPEHVFWCHDGRVFNDMAGLARGLESMSDDVYSYHANDDKNDFAKWVQDVIGDRQLAGELLALGGRAAAADAVGRRLATLTR